jgi:FkbM family methyltransferase
LAENESASVTFNHIVHPHHPLFGNGSIKHMPAHFNELMKDSCKVVPYKVPTTTYKSFIEKNDIKKVDCFVLDVEGYELNVIEGMKGCAVLPNLFMIEYPHIGLPNLTSKLDSVFPGIYRLDNVFHNSAFYLKK